MRMGDTYPLDSELDLVSLHAFDVDLDWAFCEQAFGRRLPVLRVSFLPSKMRF